MKGRDVPGRNEACWCDSARKYKHCHYDIDEAPDDLKYAASQSVYARNWRLTAQHHHNDNVYHWLAEQLTTHAPKRILDIGCGSGHGLAALRDVLGDDLEIVAIDENLSCLRETAETLRKVGSDARIVARLTVSNGPGGYRHEAAPFSIDPDEATTLVEADVCNDPHLVAALQASGPFDAVTIWLTGVHMLRQFHADVAGSGITSDRSHRLYVQNAVYELADRVLRPGGLLQVADRGQVPDTELLRVDLIQAHREQASVTSLEVGSLAYRLYDDPGHRRVPMRLTPGLAGVVPTAFTPAIISILSEKR